MLHLSARLSTLFTAAAVTASIANPAPNAARTEIEALFKALQTSGCQFSRNGSWYSPAEAQVHLTKKLEYLEDKNLVTSAEDFINLAASKSSISGKPYLVRCGSAPAIESKEWLVRQLKTLRTSKP